MENKYIIITDNKEDFENFQKIAFSHGYRWPTSPGDDITKYRIDIEALCLYPDKMKMFHTTDLVLAKDPENYNVLGIFHDMESLFNKRFKIEIP